MRRALWHCLAVAVAVSTAACGDITAGLSGMPRIDARACETADDCSAPMACCLAGVAIQVEAGETGDPTQPRCIPPDEYCDRYAPQLLAGQPCQRGGQSLDSLGQKVIYAGLDECREGLFCCPSTLNCAAAPEDCPAEPAEPPAGVGADAAVVSSGDGGAGGAETCGADPDCSEGLLCCGISYAVRAGTCVSPRACGATPYAGAPGTGDAGVTPDAASAPCERPAGVPVPGCEAPAPPTDRPGLALWMEFERAVLCDDSGQNHHGTLDATSSVAVGGLAGTGALTGSGRVPVYDTMNPDGALTLSVYVQATAGGHLLRIGDAFVMATSLCWNVALTGFGGQIESACGVINGERWTHVGVVADGTTLTLYIDGQVVASGPASPVRNLCGDVTLGGPGMRLERFSWWTRALPAEEMCFLANKAWGNGVCAP